jgi:DNA-binding PadR family transcriptional regulator
MHVSKKGSASPRDKRSRLDLELFVLALIQRGVNSAYLLLSAGISQGAALPVLGRLESSGYVRHGKPGPRGRTEFELTAVGRRHLQTGWQPLLEAPIPGDIESILRTADLSTLSGASRKTVSSYLKRAADARAIDSKNRKAEADAAKAALSDNPEAGLYRWMLAMNTVARLTAEAELLRLVAAELPKRS